jgi:SAM-dependent methyltransferase
LALERSIDEGARVPRADTTCAACGGRDLRPHLSVRGAAGPQGLSPTTTRFGVALGDIVCCERCGHMQLDPMPPEAELLASYEGVASEDYVVEAPGQRATADRILTRIEAHAKPGRLLDLGCWVGYFLDQGRRRGWNPLGVEPSVYAARYAERELGLEVRHAGLLEAELPEDEFAAVFMGDVIEHLPAAGEAIARARRSIAPGGVLALVLPDAGSRVARLLGRRWWSVIPTHVHYFTRHSIGTLLRRQGFEVLEVGTAPKTFTVRYYLGRMAGYSEPAARAMVRCAEAGRLADRLWGPDFRDRMLVIARPL